MFMNPDVLKIRNQCLELLESEKVVINQMVCKHRIKQEKKSRDFGKLLTQKKTSTLYQTPAYSGN